VIQPATETANDNDHKICMYTAHANKMVSHKFMQQHRQSTSFACAEKKPVEQLCLHCNGHLPGTCGLAKFSMYSFSTCYRAGREPLSDI